MPIPSKAVGAGNGSTAQNVFRITFSQALSANPTLESWDDANLTTNTKEIFAGTVANGHIPYLSGVATTAGAPAASWKQAVPIAGGATANRLKGLVNFVTLSSTPPGAGGNVRFNLNWELPVDATVPATNTMNSILICRYSYSGTPPALTWQYNDSGATPAGTESVPQWTTLTSGAAGNYFRPGDSGSVSGTFNFTRPAAGVIDSAVVWVSSN